MGLDLFTETHFYSIPPLIGFIVFSGIVLITLLQGRRNPTNLLFAAICFSGALINIDIALVSLIKDKALALRIDRFTYLFFVFSAPIYILFVHSFLKIYDRRRLELLFFSISFILLFFTQSQLFIPFLQDTSFGTIARGGPAYYVFSGTGTLAVLYCLATLYAYLKKNRENHFRNRIQYVLAGLGLSTFVISLNILPISGYNVYPMGNLSFIPAMVLAYGVLKYDLLDVGFVIRKGTIYFFLTAALTLCYVLVIYLFNIFFIGYGQERSLLLPLVLSVFIVILFNPLKTKVQQLVDRLFFRGKYDYQRTLREISAAMTSLLRFDDIVNLLVTSISASLQVTAVSLVLYDRKREEMGFRGMKPNGVPEGKGDTLCDMQAVAAFLEYRQEPLMKSAIGKSALWPAEKRRMEELFEKTQAALLVPMIYKKTLTGIIALGEKKSGELFVHEDMELLLTIANQSAVAFENADMYAKLEHMNIHLERKIAERTSELVDALEEKERTQKQLIQSESLAAIGQLVAGAAHELNNPLASASSLLESGIEILQEGGPEKEEREELIDDLSFSLKELNRAAEIVKSLLGLSRQTQTYVETVNLNTVIEDALRVLYNQYKYLDVVIEKSYDDNLPGIEGNFANLGQVCINIIQNAFQALVEKRGKIILVTGFTMESVYFACSDTGCGIPSGRTKDIFKPFFTTKAVGQGTGLGLYISHEIVKRHGGSIHVQSEEGKGATFTVELPWERIPAP